MSVAARMSGCDSALILFSLEQGGPSLEVFSQSGIFKRCREIFDDFLSGPKLGSSFRLLSLGIVYSAKRLMNTPKEWWLVLRSGN